MIEVYRVDGRKGGEAKQHNPVESPDSLHSIARNRILLALGEGEFEGIPTTAELRKRVMLAGTPIQNADGSENFPDVRVEFRPGTQGQAPIAGFPMVEREISIGLDVKFGNPWQATINDKDLDAVRVRIGIPRLATTEKDGDTVGGRIDYSIHVITDGGAPAIYNFAAVGKTTTLFERDHRINLPKNMVNSWRIEVHRHTADSTSDRVQNTLRVQSYIRVIDANLRYPNTALLAIEYDAKSFAQAPIISIKAKGRKVQIPSNYDPIRCTYLGDWDGTFKRGWTDNPAWHWYDICVSERFGLGRRISPAMLNRYALYEIAKRCDQLVPDGKGGQERRFKCDVYIQEQNSAWQVLKDLAAIFAGLTWWGGQMLNLIADVPMAAVSHVLTNASVVDGKFDYASGSQKTSYSTFIVNYSDPANHYKDTPAAGQRVDLVRRFKINPVSITAIGCTRESEAQRRGHWALITNQLASTVTFKVGLEGLFYIPGQVVPIADWRISGGQEIRGGRIVSVRPNQIITDTPITFHAGDKIQFRNASGVMRNLDITAAATTTIDGVERGNLTISGAIGSVAANTPFVIDGANIQTQLYRITKIERDDEGKLFTISGVEYNESKWDAVDKGARLDPRVLTLIPDNSQPAPTGITITPVELIRQGVRITNIDISWNKPDRAVAYEVQFRRMSLQDVTAWGNDWSNLPRTTGQSVTVENVFAGNYQVRVRAINASETSSPWAESAIVKVTGRLGEVPIPTNLTTTGLNWAMRLDWIIPGEAEDTLYTEIEVADNAQGNGSTLLTAVPYPATTYTRTGLPPASQMEFYRARLVDRQGNRSAWTEYVSGASSRDVESYMYDLDAQIKTTDAYKTLFEPIEMNYRAVMEQAAAQGAIVEQQWKQYGSFRADLITVSTTIADNEKALTEWKKVLLASMQTDKDQLTAAVNQKLTASVTKDGTAKASFDIGLGVTRNGVQYSGGLAMSIEPDGAGGYKTTTLVKATQFGIYSGSDAGNYKLAFVVDSDGTTYINNAMIKNGTITNAMIGNVIQSGNWDGNVGWHINKDGSAYFMNVVVKGTVYATNGSFSGSIYATDGTFNGTVYANAGVLNNVTINENCVIRGKLTVNQIEGDIVKAYSTLTNNGILIPAVAWNRTVVFPNIVVSASARIPGGDNPSPIAQTAIATAFVGGVAIKTVSITNDKWNAPMSLSGYAIGVIPAYQAAVVQLDYRRAGADSGPVSEEYFFMVMKS